MHKTMQRRTHPFTPRSVMLFTALAMGGAAVLQAHAAPGADTKTVIGPAPATQAAPSKFSAGPGGPAPSASRAAFERADANHDGIKLMQIQTSLPQQAQNLGNQCGGRLATARARMQPQQVVAAAAQRRTPCSCVGDYGQMANPCRQLGMRLLHQAGFARGLLLRSVQGAGNEHQHVGMRWQAQGQAEFSGRS